MVYKFIMENPIKLDDLGVPLFQETIFWMENPLEVLHLLFILGIVARFKVDMSILVQVWPRIADEENDLTKSTHAQILLPSWPGCHWERLWDNLPESKQSKSFQNLQGTATDATVTRNRPQKDGEIWDEPWWTLALISETQQQMTVAPGSCLCHIERGSPTFQRPKSQRFCPWSAKCPMRAAIFPEAWNNRPTRCSYLTNRAHPEKKEHDRSCCWLGCQEVPTTGLCNVVR